ncbi:MAG: hypothetical protein IPO12_08600 [Flavobacteriales bacterium]|nr:hypothetical protein [Flavobacteriales bacterium]
MRSSVFSAHCAVLMGMLAACSAGSVTFAQCTNNNTAIAGGAITPPCPGTMVVPCVQAGQYALVNVTNGNIYNFNTCAATFDTQITLFNNAGVELWRTMMTSAVRNPRWFGRRTTPASCVFLLTDGLF